MPIWKSPFNYFGNAQHSAIRSIVTLPMPMDNEQPGSYVLSDRHRPEGILHEG